MKTVNCTLTLAELAAGIREGDIDCAAVDTELQIDALADVDGPDCYPDTTLDFLRGDEVVAEVGCWVLGQYMRGPNRRDNGVYIGNGWQWQRDESDGATTGRPRATKPRNGDTTVTFGTGSSLQALTLTFSPDAESDDILADIEVIQDAIDDTYGDISVSGADDDDVYDALTRGDGITGTISLATGTGDYISIDVYGGIDAGRSTVYTYADAGEIFDDRETMLAAAQVAFRREIATAEFEIEFETLPE